MSQRLLSGLSAGPFHPPKSRSRVTYRALIATGAISAAVAAVCCATPVLPIVLGSIGLSAWLAGADYIVLPVLVLGVALTGLGLYRRHVATGYHDTISKEQSHE